MTIRAFRGSFKGGRPSASRSRVSRTRRTSRVGRPPPNVATTHRVAGHTLHQTMGTKFRASATSNAVAGHVRNHGLGYTTAPKVRGSR